jgi:hypothetical protein
MMRERSQDTGEGAGMSGPIVYVGRYKVSSENLDAFRQVAKEFAEFVEANEPQLLVYNEYVNEGGTEASAIQIHPTPNRWRLI